MNGRGFAALGVAGPREEDREVGGNGDVDDDLDEAVPKGDCDSLGVEVPSKDDSENEVARVDVENEDDRELAE